jgi:hypothetical protein
MRAMERVCPFCGEPPGPGVFCAACGRNLSAVERLPTRAEWSAGPGADGAAPAPADPAAAPADFLAAMAAAGNPGAEEIEVAGGGLRRRFLEGWVVRPVDREDFEGPKRYEPGLVLALDGSFHQLDSELRGWGQRDFPTYRHTVSKDTVDPPADVRLAAELAAVRRAHGV